MSMLSLVVAVVSLLGGIGWPEGANPSEKVGRRRLRRSKGKKDKCAKRGRRLPKDLFGKVSVLLIGLVCSWVLRAGLGGERPTGVLSADKSGYQGIFMERHRAVEARGRDSGDPRWALMRDMGVTKGGRQSMVEVEGRAWIKRRLVPRHGAQATWRAASADRPLAKAQGHRGGPTLGRYLINEAADFAARLVLAMRAVAIKRGGMSGGIGCHVAGWSKAAFHGLLRHEAGDHQEGWKRAACVRAIFAARWAAGGRRTWPRRGQGLPRGHYDCILVIVVTKCLWVDDGDGLGYYVGEESPHSPPAGPKAVPDGPIVTRLFDSGDVLVASLIQAAARSSLTSTSLMITAPLAPSVDVAATTAMDIITTRPGRDLDNSSPSLPVRSCRPSSLTVINWTSAASRSTVGRKGAGTEGARWP